MAKWTAADIPPTRPERPHWSPGQTAGSFCAALELSRAGARVVIAVRDDARGKETICKLRIEVSRTGWSWAG